MKIIHDEFTNRTDLSKQRKMQLRRIRDGLCVRCKRPVVTNDYCEEHRREVNARNRERLHRKFPAMKRYKNCASYQPGGGICNGGGNGDSGGREIHDTVPKFSAEMAEVHEKKSHADASEDEKNMLPPRTC